MDPVTEAIVGAVAAGVVTGASKVGESILVDAYIALKKVVSQKLGVDSSVVKAIESLEAKPNSPARIQVLNEEIAESNINKDQDVLKEANCVIECINSQPSLAQHIQNAVGQYIVQVDRNSTAKVNIVQPKGDK